MADVTDHEIERLDLPWVRTPVGRVLRAGLLHGVFAPITAFYTAREVVGRAELDGAEGPVIFVASHASHMDTPMILRALPRRLRSRTVVAAAADYFYRSRPLAQAVSLAFNTVPIRRRQGALAPSATEPVDRLVREGWSLLIFAEGTRSRDGSVGRLRAGAALLAAEHGCPIVPIHVAGTHHAMPPGQSWPRRLRRSPLVRRRHPVEIRFGAPIRLREGDTRHDVMERVRLFFAESGAATTPEQRASPRRERVA